MSLINQQQRLRECAAYIQTHFSDLDIDYIGILSSGEMVEFYDSKKKKHIADNLFASASHLDGNLANPTTIPPTAPTDE